MTRENYMQMLKNEYKAWLVWNTIDYEEFGVAVDHYYIFTDNEVIENFHRSDEESYIEIKNEEIKEVRLTRTLYMEYRKLEQLKEQLDEERKIKLEKVIKDMNLEKEYKKLEEIMTIKAKRLNDML